MEVTFIQIVVPMNFFFGTLRQDSRLPLGPLPLETRIGTLGVVFWAGQFKEFFRPSGMELILIWWIDLTLILMEIRGLLPVQMISLT